MRSVPLLDACLSLDDHSGRGHDICPILLWCVRYILVIYPEHGTTAFALLRGGSGGVELQPCGAEAPHLAAAIEQPDKAVGGGARGPALREVQPGRSDDRSRRVAARGSPPHLYAGGSDRTHGPARG